MSGAGDYDEIDWEPENEMLILKAQNVRDVLQASETKSIKNVAEEFPEFWELLVIDLNAGGQGADPALARDLGVNISLLNRFIKQKRPIPVNDARRLADHIVSYLRATRFPGNIVPPKAIPPTPNAEPSQEVLVVRAVEWKIVARSDELQQKIAQAVRLIGEVIDHARTTNLPSNKRALTDLERAQIMAVLKTALKVLEAPMVEKGIIKKAAAMVKHAAASAAEKKTELAFSAAGGALWVALVDLLKHL